MYAWKKKHQSAFTLIELLVVVIIVAVLAAVGVPLLSGNIQRARASEAEAALGTIRTGLRAFFAENRTYTGATFANIGITITNLTNNDGDLDGRFFDDNDYTFVPTGASGSGFCASVTGSGVAGPGNAPRAADVVGLSRSMDQEGTIFQDPGCPPPAP
ncbi:MAG: prepilin-type N-terminal cleavage/methylation domain-containing protein [Candidatus Omnitrophica bacterium]|nr:prepilin-type N-terminal cleavage/methylation domain-containing protein [Candidatus Omnitrophota bacterium]